MSSHLNLRGHNPLHMVDRTFAFKCRKCGAKVEFKGTYENFDQFMNARTFTCPGGHQESLAPSVYLELIETSGKGRTRNWKQKEGLKYVDILNYNTARMQGMDIAHIGSGVYIDRRTGKKYDYEEDEKGVRHYYELT